MALVDLTSLTHSGSQAPHHNHSGLEVFLVMVFLFFLRAVVEGLAVCCLGVVWHSRSWAAGLVVWQLEAARAVLVVGLVLVVLCLVVVLSVGLRG